MKLLEGDGVMDEKEEAPAFVTSSIFPHGCVVGGGFHFCCWQQFRLLDGGDMHIILLHVVEEFLMLAVNPVDV